MLSSKLLVTGAIAVVLEAIQHVGRMEIVDPVQIGGFTVIPGRVGSLMDAPYIESPLAARLRYASLPGME